MHLRLTFRIPDADTASDQLVAIGFTAFAIDSGILTAWPIDAVEAARIATALGKTPATSDLLDEATVYAGVIPDGAWEVAPGCWVLSGDHAAPADARAIVRMPAGGGFGDGQHPATGLACALLAGLDLNGLRVLDLGCGTGLLGVLALKLGAATADFSDVDGDSVSHTRACCAANGLTAAVYRSDLLADLPTATYDVLIANLYGEFIAAMLADSRLEAFLPAGRLVLSGISDGKLSLVEAALLRAGFAIDQRHTDAGWWGLLASRYRIG